MKSKYRSVLTHVWIVLLLILLRSIFIKNFPGPWIFSDEQSYFGMAQRVFNGEIHSITNNHMPGYPVFIAPFFAFSSVNVTYRLSQVANIVLTSGIYFLAYIALKNYYKLSKNKAIIFSVLTALLPSAISYNYLIMSENLSTVGLFVLFFISLLIIQKETLLKRILFGLVLGMLPIIKSQYLVFIITFAFLSFIKVLVTLKTKKQIDTNLILLSFISILTYFILKKIIFSQTGTYDSLIDSYFSLIPSLFTSNILVFIKQSLSEAGYIVLAVGIFPVCILILYFFNQMKNKKSSFKNFCKNCFKDTKSFLILFLIFCILETLSIAILHSYMVSLQEGEIINYGRYLDSIIPVIFCIGIAKTDDVLHQTNRKYWIVLTVTVAAFVAFFVRLDTNISYANNLAVIGLKESRFLLIFLMLLAVSLCFFKVKRIQKTVILYLCVWCLCLNISSFYFQSLASNNMKSTYSIGYYPDLHELRGEKFVLDKSMLVSQEDPHALSTYNYELSRLDFSLQYSLLFWGSKNNTIVIDFLSSYVNTDDENISSPIDTMHAEAYLISDIIMPRNFIENNGPVMLFDKHNNKDFSIIPQELFIVCNRESVSPPESDFLWMQTPEINIPVYIPSVKKLEISINLKGYWPKDIYKDVKLFVNGKPIPYVSGDDSFIFSYEYPDVINITEITIESNMWDPNTLGYANDLSSGLGLDIKSIYIKYE